MSDPTEDTDAIIKAALAEEEMIKKQRKAVKASQGIKCMFTMYISMPLMHYPIFLAHTSLVYPKLI